ncbi:protein-disulfide reductase DsbD, partial [Herbaspirillum sp. 3C11]
MFKRLLVAVRGGFLMKLWLAAMLTISLTPASASAEEYLAPEAAFRFSAVMVDAGTLQITYAIADGYYM